MYVSRFYSARSQYGLCKLLAKVSVDGNVEQNRNLLDLSFVVFFFNRTIETVSPEQLTGSAAKKPKTESIFKVTSEGLKMMSQLPERKLVRSPSSQPQMRKTERKCSSNVTLLRSPGANSACDQVSSQARVFVINPQSNSTNAKTVVQTILPATANHADSSSTVSNTVISDVSSTVEQTESVESVTTAAVKNESSSGKVATTTVSNLKLGNELPNKENVQSERTTQEVKLNTEGEEKVILESEQHENIKIEVVAVEGADSVAAGGDGGEIIEQQHLLPGQILQVRDTDGRIIHVTAGEDGELIQVISFNTLSLNKQIFFGGGRARPLSNRSTFSFGIIIIHFHFCTRLIFLR